MRLINICSCPVVSDDYNLAQMMEVTLKVINKLLQQELNQRKLQCTK